MYKLTCIIDGVEAYTELCETKAAVCTTIMIYWNNHNCSKFFERAQRVIDTSYGQSIINKCHRLLEGFKNNDPYEMVAAFNQFNSIAIEISEVEITTEQDVMYIVEDFEKQLAELTQVKT